MSWSTLAAAAVLVVLSGCAADDPADRTESPEPTLGGVSPTTTTPGRALDELEKPIAERLGRQVASQGLRLEGLDCPRWSGEVPASFECQGWFDGVPGRVSVALTEGKHGAVVFDAELLGGVISTARLVKDLEAQGYTAVDCGAVAAYPTDVGSTITCAVSEDGRTRHVLATITDESGAVTISEF